MVNIIRRSAEPSALVPSMLRDFEPFRMLRDMMSLDPFRELRLSQVEPGLIAPAFEVKETKNSYLFKGDVPGFKDDDVHVALNGQRLTISGKREEEEKSESDTYYSYESSYGAFTRSFTLPDDADADKVNAEMKQGQIWVSIPKRAGAQAKEIPIKTSNGSKKS